MKADLLQSVLTAVCAETELSAEVILSKSRKEEVVDARHIVVKLLDDHLSLAFISKATSAEEMYDTIQHELKHLTEHIGEYYGLDPKGEKSAYLQGELGRQMFPAAAIVICPNCRHSAE